MGWNYRHAWFSWSSFFFFCVCVSNKLEAAGFFFLITNSNIYWTLVCHEHCFSCLPRKHMEGFCCGNGKVWFIIAFIFYATYHLCQLYSLSIHPPIHFFYSATIFHTATIFCTYDPQWISGMDVSWQYDTELLKLRRMWAQMAKLGSAGLKLPFTHAFCITMISSRATAHKQMLMISNQKQKMLMIIIRVRNTERIKGIKEYTTTNTTEYIFVIIGQKC